MHTCKDVEHASWKVTRVKYLVHVEREQGILLARNHDHRVGPGDCRREERDEAEEGKLVGAGDANDAHRLVNLDHGAVDLRLLHGASEFIRVRSPVK